jgi:diacylglycerol kinase (ATP)
LFGGKTKRGLAGYVNLILKEYFTFNEFDSVITINGQALSRKLFIIAIANSSQYGNNARIAPRASVCDQILHINLLKKIPGYRLDFVYQLFTGQLKESVFSEVLEASSLHIATSTPIPYHIDGEPCGFNNEFDIKLIPAALQVLVPNKGTRRRPV